MLVLRLLLPAALLFVLQAGKQSYKAEIEQWRHAREANLRAENGWLTVTGLFWLKEGKNSVGTVPDSDIILPAASAPPHVGEFYFHSGVTTFQGAPGVNVTVNGKPAARAGMVADTSGSPDILQLNQLTMFVIQRGRRYGIRLKDKSSARRKEFAGLKYYPVNERYRVRARFVPYTPPKIIAVPNILGDTEMQASPGYVVFTLNGRRCRLDPVAEDGSLFFIFKDLTSGKETYPTGRFLNAEMPKNGQVVLDFNKAYNPPCAFTPFATCPLPPKQNLLPIPIEAGELRYGH
jgi:uncharacterized protein (DUF1684 family)